MTDDQTDVKEVAGEEASVSESSSEESKATEEVATPELEATAEGTEETTETVETPKKGAEARIRELNAKAKSEREKRIGLEQKIAELTRPVGQEAPQVPYTPQVAPGQEVSPEQYRQDVVGTAASIAHLINKQGETINRINNEAREVISKYPQLDPDSDQFDQELSDAVTEATEAHVRQNPYSASPKNFVEKLMRPYKRSVTKEVGQATENIAKQVSQAATRPTAISTKGGKPDSDKSVAELEAELGFIN